MAYTTLNLLSNIDRRAFSPTNQQTFTQEDRLSLITEEMESNIYPSIFNLYEEYFVTSTTQVLTVNQEAYLIPARAQNSQLREVKLINGSGNYRDLPRIEIENIWHNSTSGTPEYFFIRNNKIHMYPKPNSAADSLLMQFYVVPGTAVLPSATAIITAINTSTNVVSFSSIPATFVTGVTLDFIRGTGEHEHLGVDYTASLVSGTDVTFSALPEGLAVGDYVALQGESSLIQCPTIYRNVLAQYVAARILMDSSQSGADKAFAKAEKMRSEAENTLQPRVTGALKTFSASWF